MSKYWVPVQSSRVEFEVKKSRFIGFACKVDTREQALQALQDEKKLFPDARHHCWAYQIGAPWSPHTAAMNDDGEPNGTAGKPILNVIQHKGISHVMVVVSRYFGGVKLGAGGLVRAYSNSAEQALSTLAVSEFEPMVKVHVSCPFSEEQWLRHWLAQHEVGFY